jgi:phage tail tape-measure protein
MSFRKRFIEAAENMDWMQIVLNHAYGPPCFHLQEDGRFCGRAKGWFGHVTKIDHTYTPLHEMLDNYRRTK